MKLKKLKTIIRTTLLMGICSTISMSAVSPLAAYADQKNTVNINVDMSAFKYDEINGFYDLTSKIENISGSLDGQANDINLFSYTVTDEKGIIVKEGVIDTADNWSISDIGFVLGKNTLMLTADTQDGEKVTKSINVYNESIQNSDNLDVDQTDSDNDGLMNYWEDYFGTDKNNSDTDNDGVSDSDEIVKLGTDPLKADTSGNGINDGDNDFDNDGITNKEEIKLATDPYLADTDADSLSDFEEINTYNTDPLNADSDKDGASDGWEVKNGYNPLEKNSNFTITSISDDGQAKLYSDSLDGSKVEKFAISSSDEAYLKSAAGAKSEAYKCDSDVQGKISIKYSSDSNDEKPMIYEYSIDANQLTMLDTEENNGWLSASISANKDSLYIVIDSLKYDQYKNQVNNQDEDKTDSNNDGISDADTLKMCNGELLTNIGGKVFDKVSYEEIQANDDFDGDGIKNGDEIKIIKGNEGVNYVSLISSPVSYDSDNDGIKDNEDTAPLKRGLKDGVIGAVQIYARHDANEAFFLGHSFLVFTSYVNNETIAIDNLNRAYLYDKENDTYVLREGNDDSYTLQRGDYVSIGNYRSSGLDVAYDSVIGDYEALWTDSGLNQYLDKDNLTINDLIEFGMNGNASTVAENIITGLSDPTIRFNEEIYDTYAYENFTQCPNAVLTREITQDQLDKILEYASNHNYYNLFTNNCSSVASSAWNLAFEDNLSAKEETGLYSLFDSPMILQNHMSERDGVQKDVETFGVTI